MHTSSLYAVARTLCDWHALQYFIFQDQRKVEGWFQGSRYRPIAMSVFRVVLTLQKIINQSIQPKPELTNATKYLIVMCSRGVQQLKKISVFFCDWGGSSEGTRNLLRSPALLQFSKANPHIEFEYIRKRNAHPYMSSVYINGYIKDIPLRNSSSNQILQHFDQCNNTFGRRAILGSGKRVFGVKESFQGKWYPNMWGNVQRAEMERMHTVKQPQIKMKKKKLPDERPKKIMPDLLNDIRNARSTTDKETLQ